MHSRFLWLTISIASMCLASCARVRTPEPAVSVDPASSGHFFHHIVDTAPPGGADCCTDVLALGDVNGDGYSDIIIGAQKAEGAGLVWYEYPTWQRHDIAAGQFTTDGQAVDFDGDGDMDIVIGEETKGLLWFEQRQDAPHWVQHTLAAGYVHDIVVADLDGQGSLDVVTADKKVVAVVYNGAGPSPSRAEILRRDGEGLAVHDIDADGVADILYSNLLLQRRVVDGNMEWRSTDIDASWTVDTRVRVADINGDGRADVVLAGSEGSSTLAWYERRETAGTISWAKHPIGTETFVGAHSLQLADFDLDGDPDILLAEMNTSPQKRVEVLLNEGGGASWRAMPLARHGSHNMQAADLDGDGDVDLVGKNYQGPRFVEYWENRAADLRQVPPELKKGTQSPGAWRYRPIDTSRPAEDRQTFGLLGADLNADGLTDVLAGGTMYLRGQAGKEWTRISVAPGKDLIHVSRRRQSGWPLLLAVSPTALEVAAAEDASGTRWALRQLSQLPPGRTQGYAAGAPRANGDYDFYFTRGTTLFRLLVNEHPPTQWPLVRVRSNVQEEGVAVADLDGDGDEDVVLVDGDGRRLLWLETADGEGPRREHRLGASLRWIDRVAIADLNADGRADIVFTEESRDAEFAARVVWLEAPTHAATDAWRPHVVSVLRSANSLGVADMNSDGYPDLVVAEHTDLRPNQVASDNFTAVFRNRGNGTFATEVVEIGTHSSHLGALPLRGPDEGYEIVSVAWEQTCCVHRWVARHDVAQ